MARSTSIRQGLLRNLLLVIVLVGGGIIAVSLYAARHMLESLAREVIADSLTVTEVELQRFFEPAASALRMAADWGDQGLLDDDRPEKLNPPVPAPADGVSADLHRRHRRRQRPGVHAHPHGERMAESRNPSVEMEIANTLASVGE